MRNHLQSVPTSVERDTQQELDMLLSQSPHSLTDQLLIMLVTKQAETVSELRSLKAILSDQRPITQEDRFCAVKEVMRRTGYSQNSAYVLMREKLGAFNIGNKPGGKLVVKSDVLEAYISNMSAHSIAA